MPISERLYTVEDLYAMGEAGEDFELDEGRLVPVMPGGTVHGELMINIGARLKSFVKPSNLGKVYADVGCVLQRSPDTMRGPDVAFIREERLQHGDKSKFYEGSPDLAIEIVSPASPMALAKRKSHQYLAAGCKLVWIFDLRHEQVLVHSQDGTVKTLTRDDTLDGGNVLPGLSWSVAAVYDDTD